MSSKDNIFSTAIKYVAVEILWDIVYFPIWWYTKGLARIWQYARDSALFHIVRRLGLGIWMKSMFKPMYGDYTKEGRIISFFMRIVVLIWKLIATFMWLILLFVLIIVWIALPAVIIYYILFQVFNIPLFFIK